jgi:hypothetical protein
VSWACNDASHGGTAAQRSQRGCWGSDKRKPPHLIITLIPEEEEDEKRNIMKISEAAFDEWDNDTDSIYDAL